MAAILKYPPKHIFDKKFSIFPTAVNNGHQLYCHVEIYLVKTGFDIRMLEVFDLCITTGVTLAGKTWTGVGLGSWDESCPRTWLFILMLLYLSRSDRPELFLAFVVASIQNGQ